MQRWRSANPPIPEKYYTQLKVEERDEGYQKTNNPLISIKVTQPLVIDNDGLHGCFTAAPEDLSRVLGKQLRLVLKIGRRGKIEHVFGPIELPFNDKGEVEINVSLHKDDIMVEDDLNQLSHYPPLQPLPAKTGRLWPVSQYKVLIFPSQEEEPPLTETEINKLVEVLKSDLTNRADKILIQQALESARRGKIKPN
jgi:hypothetical protein